MCKLTIPHCLQITMDDLGWFNGTDDREQGGPSRTGIPRRHCYKDYEAVNKLGELLDMKINCAFVLGEWDPDNRLLDVPHLSKFGKNWNNAAYFNKEEAARCVEAINNAPYIDIAVHGLLHGYYMAGTDNYDASDYYYEIGGKLHLVDETEIRRRLDHFFRLLKDHGIQKKINSFIPPNFTYRWNDLARILKDYGIQYVSTIFETMVYDGEKPTIADIEDCGMVTMDRYNNLIEWDVVDADMTQLPATQGIFGVHWPNFLHMDPDRNMETVERAAEYFKACSENFGTILSRDLAFCAAQSLYHRFGKVTHTDTEYVIDLSAIPENPAVEKKFYISTDTPPVRWTGCILREFEVKKGFINYEVLPDGKTVTIAFA